MASWEEQLQDAFHQMYLFLIELDVDPTHLTPNYSPDDNPGEVTLALPDQRIGFALPGDEADPLLDDDWLIYDLDPDELITFMQVAKKLADASRRYSLRHSANSMLKSGSKEEERLLKAIVLAEMPMPNRNLVLRRDNGQELTVPDFAWEQIKLAFFVDGLWWHIGKDDAERVATLGKLSGDKDLADEVKQFNQARAERDADNRSEMTSLGWTVLSCTDRDLATDEGVLKQVNRIIRVYNKLVREKRAAAAKK